MNCIRKLVLTLLIRNSWPGLPQSLLYSYLYILPAKGFTQYRGPKSSTVTRLCVSDAEERVTPIATEIQFTRRLSCVLYSRFLYSFLGSFFCLVPFLFRQCRLSW